MFKLNASPKHQAANTRILTNLKDAGWTIDRFGHAKLDVAGKTYRYKFQAQTIRQEVLVVHPADRYSPRSTSWVRLKTLEYKKA